MTTPNLAEQPPNHAGGSLVDQADLIQGKSPYCHPDSQIDLLCRTIELAGFRANVVVTARDEKTVVTGNLILLACRRRGWRVPVEIQRFPSKAAEEAHVLSDWRTARYSKTAYDQVFEILERLEGRPVERAGFRAEQLEALGAKITGASTTKQTPDPDPNTVQSMRFLFTAEQAAEFRARLTALAEQYGKESFSEALLSAIE